MITHMQSSHSKHLLKSRGICVVIPTYNNVGSIADVIERTKAQCDDVIVVNDGSNDGTENILKSISGITVVENCKNEIVILPYCVSLFWVLM